MIVTLSSIRASPGVTSWTLLLAAAWPTVPPVERVVIEADLAGGVVGARYGVGVEPGVVAFVAGLRRMESGVEVEAHGRRVADGVWLVPGPESAERARPVWEGTAEEVATRLAADGRVWLIDAGRLELPGPLAPLAVRSALAVVVSSARAEHLLALPDRVASLRASGARVAVLIVGKASYGLEEIAGFAGAGQVWRVDESADLPEQAAAVLAGGRSRRSWLWRQACDVAARCAADAASRPGKASPASAGSLPVGVVR